VTLGGTGGPDLLIHGSVAGATVTLWGFSQWDGLQGTRLADIKWEPTFSKLKEDLCSGACRAH